MYIAGRLRTALRPSRTLILSAPYASDAPEPLPLSDATPAVGSDESGRASGVAAADRCSSFWGSNSDINQVCESRQLVIACDRVEAPLSGVARQAAFT